MRECVGLRSPVSMSGGEGEHPVSAPGKSRGKRNGELQVAIAVRKSGSSEDRVLLGPRVDVRQDEPKVRS